MRDDTVNINKYENLLQQQLFQGSDSSEDPAADRNLSVF